MHRPLWGVDHEVATHEQRYSRVAPDLGRRRRLLGIASREPIVKCAGRAAADDLADGFWIGEIGADPGAPADIDHVR